MPDAYLVRHFRELFLCPLPYEADGGAGGVGAEGFPGAPGAGGMEGAPRHSAERWRVDDARRHHNSTVKTAKAHALFSRHHIGDSPMSKNHYQHEHDGKVRR